MKDKNNYNVTKTKEHFHLRLTNNSCQNEHCLVVVPWLTPAAGSSLLPLSFAHPLPPLTFSLALHPSPPHPPHSPPPTRQLPPLPPLFLTPLMSRPNVNPQPIYGLNHNVCLLPG